MRHGSSGKFWQGRFKSKPVEIGEYLVRCARYIERNPVRAEIVDDAWDYKWSSSRRYVTGNPDGITDVNTYIGAENWQIDDRREYAKSLELSDDDSLLSKHRNKGYIGGDKFHTQFKKEGGRYRKRRGRPVKQ
jgi:putative transposase